MYGAIPAWAGEPSAEAVTVFGLGGHPRVGGGTVRMLPHISARLGPSPRGRGNPIADHDFLGDIGAIPAWAGEPMASVRSASVRSGPSPRGRGNRSGKAADRRGCGAIPAWAGEPTSGSQRDDWVWGHPRVGGGTCTTMSGILTCHGPSPRGRGNPAMRDARAVPNGAIPAWAGEPIGAGGDLHRNRGHPRVGGGTIASAPTPWVWQGPSPRGRGNWLSR